MSRTIDLTGQRFGRWLVIEQTNSEGPGKWRCLCDCGTERSGVSASGLTSGTSQSCGCLRAETCAAKCRERTRHGASYSPEYKVWIDSKSRCASESHHAYARYGGRGLKHDFPTFESFINEVGLRPSPQHSLERIDNDKGYVPGNVMWATTKAQSRNRSSNKILSFLGQTMCITDWARQLGVNQQTLSARLAKGWSVEATLSTPVKRGQKRPMP
jgi:hypothetical protein